MNKRIWFIVLISCIFFGSVCNKSREPNKTAFYTAVSVFPVYDIARNIGGDRMEFFYAVPVGANPHIYEPKPSEIVRLQATKLFIGISREFDGSIADRLPKHVLKKYFIGRDASFAGYDARTNPHIWLCLKGAARIAHLITRYISEADPEGKRIYTVNLKTYLKRLQDLDKKIKPMFKNIQNRKFIQWHPAWDFFAAEYGLKIAGTIQYGHGDTPSVRTFKQLVDLALKNRIYVIVIGLAEQSRVTEALSGEINGLITRLDSIGDPDIKERSSFIKLMYYNALTLSKALKTSNTGAQLSR